MKQLTTIVLALLLSGLMSAQQDTKIIKKSFTFASTSKDNMILIRNINGGIEVMEHDGNQAEMELELIIKGSSSAVRDRGFSEVKLGVIEKSKTIALYMDAPCSDIDARSISEEDLRKGRFNQWVNNCQWHPKYDYRLNFKVKIPKGTNLEASTVNHGDVLIEGVSGKIRVNNVNGAIALHQVQGGIEAHTINGDLDVTYTSNPTEPSSYYSLNGDINTQFISGLSADALFKSFNGDFYTDIDQVEVLPVIVEKEVSNEKGGVKFKIGQNKGLKIRNGGVRLSFETFNGNVYVKEK